MPVDPLDDIVGDLAVRGVAPPDQDVQVVEHLLGQAVLGFVERGGVITRAGHRGSRRSRGDGGVHAVGIDGGDVRLDLLVPVLPPDENADLVGRTCGHVVPSSGQVRCRVGCYFTAPPVAPAAMYFWAMTSRMIAGIEASMAVAITALQFEMCAPR